MQEQIVSTKSCRRCQKSFAITDKDIEFYTKISPSFPPSPSEAVGRGSGGGHIKYHIPTPTLCPDCRQMRRLSFRNERNLYKRKCDASGKDIISIYKPSKPLDKGGQGGFVVYDQKIRRSDAWDPMDYGRDFDFSRSFTEQFGELIREVPRMSLLNMYAENSEYCNPASYLKNCYLLHGARNSENCMYGTWIDDCIYCSDCLSTNYSEYCYQCIDCTKCFECKNCLNCNNCSYCINCVDLVGKKYCIGNIQYSKEEFLELQKTLSFETSVYIQHDKKLENLMIENCIGSHLKNCVNCFFCKDLYDSNDMKFSNSSATGSSNCYDISFLKNCHYIYEYGSCINQSKSAFGFSCRDGSDLFYCETTYNSTNCFGCIGLRNKSYCIFNKQYSKEEYEILVPKIIAYMTETGEWGEFFHPSLSPFGYNETVAMEYYPVEQTPSATPYPPYQGEKAGILSGDLKNDVYLPDKASVPLEGRGGPLAVEGLKKHGFTRSSYISPAPLADRIIEGKNLPATIAEVDDDILKIAVKCEISGKLFRIIPQELAFYRKHNIPLPRKHPDQRHKERMELRK